MNIEFMVGPVYGLDMKNTQKQRHGKRWSKEYSSWICIKSRCLNPKNTAYERYGGKSIEIYEGWISDFNAFYHHVGDAPSKLHTIDRINNKLGYFPGNVRWATPEQQRENRENTLRVTYLGRSETLVVWAKELDIPYLTLRRRLIKGWPSSEILNPNYKRRSTKGEL